mmetsp:Transcript_11924/g.32049  ORF Transcript_11924/g.32049 Transcript_11924/m.32049 type:complete len:236 (+) Transcript_11924:475-1182(+)
MTCTTSSATCPSTASCGSWMGSRRGPSALGSARQRTGWMRHARPSRRASSSTRTRRSASTSWRSSATARRHCRRSSRDLSGSGSGPSDLSRAAARSFRATMSLRSSSSMPAARATRKWCAWSRAWRAWSPWISSSSFSPRLMSSSGRSKPSCALRRTSLRSGTWRTCDASTTTGPSYSSSWKPSRRRTNSCPSCRRPRANPSDKMMCQSDVTSLWLMVPVESTHPLRRPACDRGR